MTATTHASPVLLARNTVGKPYLAVGLIVFFVVFGALSVQRVSTTADENYHLRYGANILQLRAKRFDDSKMPISALNALPGALADRLAAGALKDFLSGLFAARLVTILFSAGVAYLVYHWSGILYGASAGLASLLLYIFDPNIIAHSQLVTTDVYAAGCVLAVSYWTWRFAERRTWLNGLICAATLGLSQLAKYSTVVLLPLMLLALAVHDAPGILAQFREKGPTLIAGYVARLTFYALGAVVVILTCINLGFVLYRPLVPLGQYAFHSSVFQSLQKVPILQGLPVPLPYPYLQGLDLVSFNDQTGWSVYLLGQLRSGRGFPGYYFVASALKTPIATQIVLLLAFVIYAIDGARRKRFLETEIFLVIPLIFYAIYFNFLYNSQLGIRFYLVEFPLLYVFAGTIFARWPVFGRAQKTAAYTLLAYLVVSVLSYYPFYLAYFNEAIWDRRFAYKYLADSNLEWGQDAYYVRQFRMAFPAAMHVPPQPRSGVFFISASELVGVSAPRARYEWIRDHFEPVGTIAYGYLVYVVRPADLITLCRESTLCP